MKAAPSFTFAPTLPETDGRVGTRSSGLGLEPGEVAWPEGARSVLVIAVEHPADRPEMDWWFGRSDPPGNRILASIVQRLCDWIPEAFGIQTFHMPYHIERGGTYLKDAAVLAGLGCIGRNNLLVTREYGPRVRLRALTLDVDVPSTGPLPSSGALGFDPCEGCDAPCLQACPQGAFDRCVYDPVDLVSERLVGLLPGRTGHFSRAACNIQMEADIENAVEQPVATDPCTPPDPAMATGSVPAAGARVAAAGPGADGAETVEIVKYCRACELSCPVGCRSVGGGVELGESHGRQHKLEADGSPKGVVHRKKLGD
jgi:epoxyqueuosine reductase